MADQKDENNFKKLEKQLALINSDDGATAVVRDMNIYLVASCCDWLPIKMKTRRVLQLEKLAMDEPAPA